MISQEKIFTDRTILLFIFLILLFAVDLDTWAQLDPTGRSGDRPPEFLPGEPREPSSSILVPPIAPPGGRESAPEQVPSEQQPHSVLPPVSPSPKDAIPGARVFVHKIEVTGNTVFSARELATVTAPYENRVITTEDLEALRLDLTRLYISKGYINSGSVIPDQTVTDGVVKFTIIEGGLTKIELEGNRWFQDHYFLDRLQLDAGPPLNVNQLQERLQLFLQNPNVVRLNAELKPGVRPGESVLHLRVRDRQPFQLWTEYNNYQVPTVGSSRGLVTFIDQNVTGNSDLFYFQYGASSGLNPLLDVSYAIPFTPYDTSFRFRYRKNDYGVVEEPFGPLNIDTESEIFSLAFRQPFWRSADQEFALEVMGERLSSQSSLLGKGFSFTPGTKNGKAVTTPIRFAQEWLRRTAVQVFALRSQFSFGTDALGATQNTNDSLPNARFFVWLGQFQWARRFQFLNITALWRANLQLTGDALFPLEQIAVGGRYSVRGYRENTLVRDNGVINQLEVRVPLITDKVWADYVQLAPFLDFGTAWNSKLQLPGPKTIASIGMGLRWALTMGGKGETRAEVESYSEFEFYWGAALRRVSTQGGDLQDYGIHLRFATGFR